MPDWSYRTLLRPALFGLGAERAQRVALGALSTLSRVPGGLALVDFMGHMRVDPRLALVCDAVRSAGPVGLAGLIDPGGAAAPALARFGVGFVEVGPVASAPRAEAEPFAYRLDGSAQSLRAAARERVVEADALAARLRDGAPLRAPCWVRLVAEEPAACARAVHALREHASAFVVDAGDAGGDEAATARIAAVVEAAGRGGAARAVLLAVRADHPRAVAVPVRAADPDHRGESAGAARARGPP